MRLAVSQSNYFWLSQHVFPIINSYHQQQTKKPRFTLLDRRPDILSQEFQWLKVQAPHSDYSCAEKADAHIVQWHHLQTTTKLIITWPSQEVIFICPKSGKSVLSVPLDLQSTISEHLLLQQKYEEYRFPSKKRETINFVCLNWEEKNVVGKRKMLMKYRHLWECLFLGWFF